MAGKLTPQQRLQAHIMMIHTQFTLGKECVLPDILEYIDKHYSDQFASECVAFINRPQLRAPKEVTP